MINFDVDPLPDQSGLQVRASRHGQALSYGVAFFFETPPLTTATLEQRFEFVLIDAPSLARVSADSHAFRAKLDAREQVATFRNLGGDAVLVVPCDHGADYAHLASFVRTADAGQIHALWRDPGRRSPPSVAQRRAG